MTAPSTTDALVTGPLADAYSFTETPSRYAALDLTEYTATWEYWRQLFSAYEVRTEKDGTGFVLGSLSDCPSECAGTGKNCGGGRAHRLAYNVRSVHAFGIDLDGVQQAEVDAFTTRLINAGLAFHMYHTHGHRGSDYVKVRGLVPLVRPVVLDHQRQWAGHYWPLLMAGVGLAAGGDRSVRDPSRIFYAPAKPDEDAPHEAWSHAGDALDAQATCGAPPLAVRVQATYVEPLAEVDLKTLSAQLAEVTSEPARSLIKRVLRNKAPVPPPDKRAAGLPSRYEAWRTLAFQLAITAAEGTPSSALKEFLRESFEAEVRESPDDHTDWHTVDKLVESALPAAARIRAENRAISALKSARFNARLSKFRSGGSK